MTTAFFFFTQEQSQPTVYVTRPTLDSQPRKSGISFFGLTRLVAELLLLSTVVVLPIYRL
jgi:hypothetical protein